MTDVMCMPTSVMADEIPRYGQPMDPMDVVDERETCDGCMHCSKFSDYDCRLVLSRMTPYGSWDRRRMRKEISHALRCLGKCEVTGDLVDLEQGACGHYSSADDE